MRSGKPHIFLAPFDELADPRTLVELARQAERSFDLVAEIGPGQDPEPWEAAGATWVLPDFEAQPRLREVEAAIAERS